MSAKNAERKKSIENNSVYTNHAVIADMQTNRTAHYLNWGELIAALELQDSRKKDYNYSSGSSSSNSRTEV